MSRKFIGVVSPSVLNHLGAGLSRFRNPTQSLTYGQGWISRLGLKGLPGDEFPGVLFSNDYHQFGEDRTFNFIYTNLTLLDTLSIVRAAHSLKVGFEIQSQRNNINTFNLAGGEFTFDRLSTGLPGVAGTGNPFASFLLGDVYTGAAYFPGLQSGSRSRYYAPWINDDWKVGSRLTLNLGLRWEIQPAFNDPNNRLSWMDPSVANPRIGGYPGAYVFAGSGPGRLGTSKIGNTHWRDFSPRIGLAYRITQTMVFRAGYGRYFAQLATFNGGAGVPTDGFNATPRFTSGNNGISPAFNWDSGFPQNFARPPVIDPAIQNGFIAYVNDRNRIAMLPYTHQFNGTIEKQIGRTLSLSASYVGTLGHRLIGNDRDIGYDPDLNQVNPSFLRLGNMLSMNILDPSVKAAGFKEPFPGFAALWGDQATLAQALRRYPQYSNVYQNVQRASYFNSSYHAFQFKTEKRLSHGLTFTLAYTYSKSLSNMFSGTRDWFNRNLDKGLDGSHHPQILTFSYGYDLPFGKGRALLDRGGALEKLVGGWKLSGIQSYNSGNSLSVSVANSLPLFNPQNFPNVVSNNFAAPKGSGGFDPGRGDLWLNPAAFAVPAPFTFGNAPVRLNFRGPMGMSESLALLKDITWKERFRMQFRMEAQNPFNRVVFGDPNTMVGAGSFGMIGGLPWGATGRQIQFGLKLYY